MILGFGNPVTVRNSVDWKGSARPMEEAWQSSKVRGHPPPPTHTPVSKAQFRPDIKVNHTCTAHGWLGIPTRQMIFFFPHWSLKHLILLWCGQLKDFCSGQLPVARIMLPGSYWPHPAHKMLHVWLPQAMPSSTLYWFSQASHWNTSGVWIDCMQPLWGVDLWWSGMGVSCHPLFTTQYSCK